jgi:hypothetical protein
MFFGKRKELTIPLSENLPSVEDNYSIVWVGQGQSYAYQNGQYVRSESNDYGFEVIQRRYGNTWRSIKNQYRIHPDYDGRAGAREQTLYFEIEFSKVENRVVSAIRSSLGNGTGVSDHEFREQTIQFAAKGVSSFAPYNTYRITQHYLYEEGMLKETVELFKLKNGKEIPFVKIEEQAYIFRPIALETAPTTFAEKGAVAL